MNAYALNTRAINGGRRPLVVYPFLPNLTYTILTRDGILDSDSALVLASSDIDYRMTITFISASQGIPLDIDQTAILGAI